MYNIDIVEGQSTDMQDILTKYTAINERMKVLICRDVADSCPKLFKQWYMAGKIEKFRLASIRDRRYKDVQERLDRALTDKHNRDIAYHVFIVFFTEGRTGSLLNQDFLSIADPSYESPDRTATAEMAIKQLSDTHSEQFPGLVSLYTACLMVVNPEWFDSSLPPRKRHRDEKCLVPDGVVLPVPHDVAADAAESEEEVHCHCSMAFLTKTDKILNDFCEAMNSLKGLIEDIPKRSIDESEGLLSQISEAYVRAVQRAEVVSQRHKEVKTWAPPSIPTCGETGCELCRHDEHIELTESPNLSAIEDAAAQLRGLVAKTRTGMSALKTQFDETVHNIEILAEDLEEEIGISHELPSENLLQVVQKLSELKELLEHLTNERSELLQELGSKAISELDDFHRSNQSTEKDDAKIAHLRSLVSSAKSLKELREILGKVDLFNKEAAERHNATDYVAAAKRALVAETDPITHLRLVECCLKARQPELAYCLLDMLQEKWKYDDMLLADGAPTTESALTTVAEACVLVAEAAGVHWPVLLANQPWVADLSRTDIESRSMRGALTIIWATALSFWSSDAVLESRFRQHGDMDTLSGPQCLQLATLVGVLRDGGSVVIGDVPDDSVAKETRRQVDQWFEKKQGRFIHVVTQGVEHLMHIEREDILPELEGRWIRIVEECEQGNFAAARASASYEPKELYREALKRSAVGAKSSHEHLTPKLLERMAKIRALFDSFIEICERRSATGVVLLNQQELRREAQAFIDREQPLSVIRQPLLDLLAYGAAEDAKGYERDAVLLALGQQRAELVRWLHPLLSYIETKSLSQAGIAESVLAEVCEAIASPLGDEDLTTLLSKSKCLKELAILQGTQEAQDNFEQFVQRQIIKLDELRGDGKGDGKGDELAQEADEAIRRSRYPRAALLLQNLDERIVKIRAEQKLQVSTFIKNNLLSLEKIKKVACGANVPEEWLEQVWSLAGKLEMQLRRLDQACESQAATHATQARLDKAVTSLEFLVEQHSSGFDEVTYFLNPAATRPVSTTLTSEDKDSARSKCPALHNAWEALARTDKPDVRAVNQQWASFVKEFAKACNLYRDEHDEQRRFTTVPSVKYPFSVYETAFYQPQSEFLKRPLRLYLYRQLDVDIQALQRLEDELSGPDAAAWLHIVFAPQGYERIKRHFKYDTRIKDFLLVDEDFFYRVSGTDKHDVPLRQALHGAVTDLANSSPFVAQGYCHQNNNIYVGRTDILKTLRNTPHAMIWGGRRIGKTSVLHALENSLRRTTNYRVAYVYVDLQDTGDPDISVAKKISTTLGLPEPATIPEFEKQVSGLRNEGVRLAFLIDEVDEYIKKSRAAHGDEFPLATTLRQLVMDDADKVTRLVYSGYHQLYYEAKLDRGKRRVGHPFVNTGQDIPIRNLNPDDVKKLVTMGFVEMLDIRVSPDVPNLIFRRASGHPAFVQQFCRCLLDRVSRRRSATMHVTITADDVEAVYNASTKSESGEDAFITYVDETLGYNLSHLGRAIMLTVCNLPGAQTEAENEAAFFSIKKVSEELNGWCEYVNVPKPEQKHFDQTVELLVMTNMLTQNPQKHDSYRVTYPTYIDILKRLDKLKPSDFGHSLQEYSKNERERGVLL